MNKTAVIVTLFLLQFHIVTEQTQAQSAELIGGNVLNGAITGSILGVAVMGLNDTSDFTAVRVGLGSGILYGTGIAIYDVASVPRGQRFFISGLFNDGENSSIIILLDTVYGAAVGVGLGSAFALIADKPITDALQYGASAGAWAGFGFGLIDAFFLAEKNRDFTTSNLLNRDSLISIQNSGANLKFIRPAIHTYTDFSADLPVLSFEPVIHLISVNKRF